MAVTVKTNTAATHTVATGASSVRSQIFELPEALTLRSGETLARVHLSYESYGKLNVNKDNAILIFHALTGSQHLAGENVALDPSSDLWTGACHRGWWDDFVGPGKAVDTDKFFVLCANYIGGCYGSTGPCSVNATTGQVYQGDFPRVSFHDIVDTQMKLVDSFGIEKLRAVIGPSVGGMASLSLATRYADRVGIVIPIATGLSATPLQRIHNYEQINAIEKVPFQIGDAQCDRSRDVGLAMARMISHKTFVSLSAMQKRARGFVESDQDDLAWYRLNHPLESYIKHQGDKFCERFDRHAYLRILDAWQRFDLLAETGCSDFESLFERCRAQRYLLFSIDSDVCFYPGEQEHIERHLLSASVPVMRITVHSEKGHDAFLLEPHLFAPHLNFVLTGQW